MCHTAWPAAQMFVCKRKKAKAGLQAGSGGPGSEALEGPLEPGGVPSQEPELACP